MAYSPIFADDCGTPPSWCIVEGELQKPFDTVVIDLGPTTTMISVQIRDMGIGTIYFEVTLDGEEWLPQSLLNTESPVFSSETTVDGNWRGAVAGWTQFRVRAGDPYTGSNAQITLMCSEGVLSGVPGPAYVFIGDVPPPNPIPGTLWWSSALGELFISYDDGNSQQWVVTNLGGSTLGRMASLNLRDYMYGDYYVNNAFRRAQDALLMANLRDLYVPGGTYYADPALPEIQLVLDDLHIWADNAPLFHTAQPMQGFFHVVYAQRVRIEGISIVMDASIDRQDYPFAPASGGWAGESTESRRCGIGIFDSDDFYLDSVFIRNFSQGFMGRGHLYGPQYDPWKALSPAQRIATYAPLQTAKTYGDVPDTPYSIRRAQGFTRAFRLSTEHCDMGILYNSIENMRVERFTARDTTIQKVHPHAIYAGGNMVHNEYKRDPATGLPVVPPELVDPTKPLHALLKDKSNGTGVFNNLRDFDNPYANSFKFRIHDKLVVTDAYSQNTAGGIVLNNNYGATVNGVVVVDLHEGSGPIIDDPDDPDGAAQRGNGLVISGCRNAVVSDVSIYTKLGDVRASPVLVVDTLRANQRRNTETGERYYSEGNLLENILVKTNYAGVDENHNFDPADFDPDTIEFPFSIFKFGDDNGSLGKGTVFRNCKHVDAWGIYVSPMFELRAGSGHKIITPSRDSTEPLVLVHADSTDNLVVIDPDLVGSRSVIHNPPPLTLLGADYTRVHVIRAIKGDNEAYLADFGPLDTAANVAETINRAATIVGSRGPGTIHLPAGELLAGPYVPTQIAPDEGTTIILTDAMNGITWQGHSTTFKLVSNKVAVFEIDGAKDSKFRGIRFDCTEHGYLNRNPGFSGGAVSGAGGGVAANGNAANCAIRQWTGANLTVWDCDFDGLHTGVQYFGNVLDSTQLVGTADMQNCRFNGVAMGFLPSCAEHVICNGNFWLNGWDSFRPTVEDPRIVAPGHLLYITGGNTAAPYTVTANNNYARHAANSVLKMRKGITQVCTGNDFQDCYAGIESHNAKNTTITGNTIKLVLWPTNRVPLGRPESEGYAAGDGSGGSAIMVTGCESGGVVANNTIDKSGAAGYAMRVRAADLAEDPEGEVEDGQYPRNLHIHHNTISDSCPVIMIQTRPAIEGDPLPPMSVAPILPWMMLTHLTDCIVEDNVLHITADVVTEEWMIRANLCERTKFLNNARTNPFRSAGSERLLQLQSGCNDCVVGWKSEDIPVVATAYTINNNGSNTRRLRTDGIMVEEWTPVPAFETAPTPTAFIPANVKASGWIERQGRMATIGCNLTFDTNAYTVPGTPTPFKILFPYTADTFAAPFYNSVGFHRRLATGANSNIGVAMRKDEPFLTLRYNEPAGDGKQLTNEHIPPSTLGIDLAFQLRVYLNSTAPFDRAILPETQDLITKGWTPTTTTVLQRVDQCIRDLKTYGLWDKILACWGANTRNNWKNANLYKLTAVGAAGFIEDDYFAGLGTDTDYWGTQGLNLATLGGGIYTQNSASMWRWSTTKSVSDTAVELGTDAVARVSGMTLASQLSCFTNSVAGSFAPVAHSTGLAGWTRTSSSSVMLFKDKTTTVLASTSTAVPTAPLRIGHGGTAGSGSGRRMKFAGVGAGLTTTDIDNLARIIGNYALY